MKKQLIILIVLFFICPFAWSQDRWIKTTTPCNVELLKQSPGRWLPTGQMFYAKTSKQEGGMVHMLTQYPIFTTQANGVRLLVTENPAYMKKELPKYIPQFMYYTQWNCDCGADQSLNPYKLIDEKFPIEKVQAMIDK